MNKKVYIIPLVIFSLLLIGAKPLKSLDSPSFFDLNEQAIIKNGDFIQNGVKMNYYSKADIEIEYERLLEVFNMNDMNEEQLNNNRIVYKNLEKDISVTLWEEDSKTMVEVIYINNNSSRSSLSLKKELEKLQNNNSTKEQYCSFVKGKIKEESNGETEKLLRNSIEEDTLKTIYIHNGHTSTAKFKDGQRVNIGYMKYDSGRQVIIGTPVIFVTY